MPAETVAKRAMPAAEELPTRRRRVFGALGRVPVGSIESKRHGRRVAQTRRFGSNLLQRALATHHGGHVTPC